LINYLNTNVNNLRTKENFEPTSSTNRPRLPLGREPPPVTFPSRNKLQSSFGGYNTSGEPQPSADSYDFLPSASFDDLHSSIATASNGLGLEPFPKPAREENMAGSVSMARAGIMDSGLSDIKGTSGNRGASTTRPVRSGSLLRRTSISTRQTSISSTASGASGNMDPPTAPLAMRTRRQSQYPPISSNNTAKNTRKSIGPGVVDTEFSARTSSRRRPSLASSTSAQNMSDTLNTGRTFGSSVNSMNEGGRLLTARAAKSKSLQPPSRQTPAHLNPSVMTPEHARSSSFAGRSPGRNGRNTSTPSSSARRMSTMPSTNHASGLGARTISPTDARRMKRLSTLNGVPPMPHTPPANQLEAASVPRASSRSPSMLPRKAPTPSSSRTTPDPNRKSYSSGLSMVSNGSNTTARTSTGSLQPRLPQSLASSSRLPTPKLRNVHSSTGNEDEEEVPPVPAIPKAYESPKDSAQEVTVFTSRKSSLPFDAISINSTSTNELSGNSSVRERLSIDPPSRARRNMQHGGGSDIDQKANGVSSKKKHLQPLRLPPLNLLPLSIPTTEKIAALNEPSFSQGNVTPPPKRSNAKTPSTPMTASKASFFLSRNRRADKDEQDPEPFRSSTSVHHHTPIDSTLSQDDTASFVPSQPMAVNSNSQRHAVSPFVSSSLPKSSGEFSFLPRSKTSGDFTTSTESIHEQRPAKLTGPRVHKLVKSPKTETAAESSPEEPNTPSSATSLRRKLSLGWRRNTSKSSINLSQVANEKDQGHPPQPPKHNDMPPPRLPASATMNSMNNVPVPSPSPSIKSTTYLDSKRRKSSTSSLSLFTTHDRTRSDSWGLNRSPKKDDTKDVEHPKTTPSRSTSSIMGPVHRMVGSKSSIASMKPADPWAIDLDKDDVVAEEEMKKLGSRRKETENAARLLDALRKRATPKERVSPQHAIQVANLNIYERGEIVDYKDIFFCGTQNAAKKVGQLQTELANFGYDDERGDYAIVSGDHLSFRYEIIDILGKGSFGQVVRCIDHKTGGLVAIKIIRNKKRFHQQALVEVNILQKLREWVGYIFLDRAEMTNSVSRIHKTNIAWSTSLRAFISVVISASLPNSLI
jgi:dual specificity tyrosine-phosphorylation-regulated kinase 2/3/4